MLTDFNYSEIIPVGRSLDDVVWNRLLDYAQERNIPVFWAVNLTVDEGRPVKGLWVKMKDGNETIFLLSTLSNRDANYVLGHELGHSVMHQNGQSLYHYTSEEGQWREREADYFGHVLVKLIQNGHNTDLKVLGKIIKLYLKDGLS